MTYIKKNYTSKYVSTGYCKCTISAIIRSEKVFNTKINWKIREMYCGM